MGKFKKSVKVVTAISVNGHVYSTPEKAATIIFNKMRTRMYDRHQAKGGNLWTDMPWRRKLVGLEARGYARVLRITQQIYDQGN